MRLIQHRFLAFSLAVAALSCVLAGCGQRGPLYLPDEAPPAQQNTGSPEADRDEQDEQEVPGHDAALDNGNLQDESTKPLNDGR